MGLIDREKVVAGRGTSDVPLSIDSHRTPRRRCESRRLGRRHVARDCCRWKTKQFEISSFQRWQHGWGDSSRCKLEADQTEDSFEGKNASTVRSHVSKTNAHRSDRLPASCQCLDIGMCPFPTLTDVSDDRAMCRLEEQMISEALGQPVHLSSCRLDGDDCCQFSAVTVTTEGTASGSATETETGSPGRERYLDRVE